MNTNMHAYVWHYFTHRIHRYTLLSPARKLFNQNTYTYCTRTSPSLHFAILFAKFLIKWASENIGNKTRPCRYTVSVRHSTDTLYLYTTALNGEKYMYYIVGEFDFNAYAYLAPVNSPNEQLASARFHKCDHFSKKHLRVSATACCQLVANRGSISHLCTCNKWPCIDRV